MDCDFSLKGWCKTIDTMRKNTTEKYTIHDFHMLRMKRTNPPQQFRVDHQDQTDQTAVMSSTLCRVDGALRLFTSHY